MYQRRLALLLFTPSILSGAGIIFLAALLNAYGAWTFIHNNQLFYGFFSGAYGIQTYLWETSYGLSAWSKTFLSSSLAYYVLVAGVAVIAGLAVFALLQVLGVVQKEGKLLSATQGNRTYHHEVLSRLGLRAVSIIGWTLFTAFFVSTLLPFVSLLNEMGVDAINNGEGGWLYCAASLALLILALHIHVIFARLVALRPRLFGGMSEIEKAESVSPHKLDEI